MHTYTTIMYAKDLAKSEYWLGEVDENGIITNFIDFILEHDKPQLLNADNMFYYVTVETDGEHLVVEPVQWYMAMSKTEPSGRPIADMVKDGTLNPLESANKLMELHQGFKRN